MLSVRWLTAANVRSGARYCLTMQAEMVFGKPDAVEALLLGERNLLERLADAPCLALRGPWFWHLDLIE
jgi:hypothetical protein